MTWWLVWSPVPMLEDQTGTRYLPRWKSKGRARWPCSSAATPPWAGFSSRSAMTLASPSGKKCFSLHLVLNYLLSTPGHPWSLLFHLKLFLIDQELTIRLWQLHYMICPALLSTLYSPVSRWYYHVLYTEKIKQTDIHHSSIPRTLLSASGKLVLRKSFLHYISKSHTTKIVKPQP